MHRIQNRTNLGIRVAIFSFLLCLNAHSTWAFVPLPQYQLVVLSPLPGDIASQAEDMNQFGMTVGISSVSSTSPKPVIWDGSNVQEVGSIVGYAVAVNDTGHVAGHLAQFPSEPFYWDGSNLHMVQSSVLSQLGGANYVMDFSNDDQIVGFNDRAATPYRSAYLWENGATILLGTLGGPNSVALTINNRGQVGGWAETPNQNARAYIWSDDNHNSISDPGEMRQLPDVGLSSAVNCINDNGHAAGWINVAFLRQPVIWRNANSFTQLPNLPGKAESEPFDINIHDDMVGTSLGVAVLWHDGVIYDLNQLKPAGSPLNLLRANAINDSGWIAGYGLLGNNERGFLLIPIPEPNTTLLVAVGVVVLAGLRKRNGTDKNQCMSR